MMKCPHAAVLATLLSALLFAVAAVAAFSQTRAAQTGTQKVVAVVVDDSGSMWRNAYLPGFGLQVLATALDPDRGDRLAVFTLSSGAECLGPSQTTWVSLDPAQWDITRPCLATAFEGGAGTPYGKGIPRALDLLRSSALAGIEAHLIVFSDGGFDDLPRDRNNDFIIDEIVGPYEQVRAELDRQRASGVPTGSIQVDFVAIGAEKDGFSGGLNEDMIKQKVRYGLLNVFNGFAEPETCKPEQGCWAVPPGQGDVAAADMWRTLRAIIANIGNTDISANTGFLSYSGRTVLIDSPLTISRIVVATAHPVPSEEASIVILEGARGGVSGPLPIKSEFLTSIAGPDANFGNLLMKGQSAQLAFPDPGLPPQRTELEFSGPSCPNGDPCDVFLLFDILTTTSLRIEDATGEAPPIGGDGDYQLRLGGDYRVVAELLNPDGSKVDLSHPGMTSASFQLVVAGTAVDMQINSNTSQAVYAFTSSTQETDIELRATPVLPGFGTPPSELVRYDVIDTSANLSIGRFEPAHPCNDCAEGEHQAVIDPNAAPEVGTFELGNRARHDGAIRFDLSGMHPGFRLITADGMVIADSDVFDMASGEVLTLSLLMEQPFPADQVASNPVLNDIVVHPAGAWTGPSVSMQLRSRLDAPGLEINGLMGVETCNGCPRNTLRSLLRPGPDDVQVGEFTLTDPGEMSKPILFEIVGNGADFYLADDTGTAIGAGGLTLSGGRSVTVRIMRNGVMQTRVPLGLPFRLRVVAERTLDWALGTASIEFAVSVLAPQLKIWVHSHDSDPTGVGPLEVTGRQLRNSDATALIALENLLDPPADGAFEGAFDFGLDSVFAPFHSYSVIRASSVPDHDTALGVEVAPSVQYWCLCFIGIGDMFGSGRREVEVTFLDPVNGGAQRGATSLLKQYQVSASVTAVSCAWNMLYLALALTFIRGVIGGLAARRFPRHSEVEVHSPDTGELFDDMRGLNWTWVRCWATIFVGPPHERITVEGMEFEATSFGPALVTSKSVPAWRAEGRGNKLLEELTIESEPLLQMFWGDKLVDTTRKKTWIRFHEDYTNRHE